MGNNIFWVLWYKLGEVVKSLSGSLFREDTKRRGWRHPLRMFNRGFSYVTLLVSMVLLMGTLMVLVEVLSNGSIGVVVQGEKTEAILLAQEILEEMYNCDLHTIKTRDWTTWAKNNTVYGDRLRNLQVKLEFPYAYPEEEHHYANRWGYTYEKGYVWSGFLYPEYTRSLLPVSLTLEWEVKGVEMHLKVDTIFSEIPRGL